MSVEAGNENRAAEELLARIGAAARSGDDARAYELAIRALDDGLQHPLPYNVRGSHFWNRGQYREALSDFESARTLTPRNPAVWNAIGNCLLKLTRWREAIAAFDSAIGYGPNFARAHHHRGMALQMVGQRAPAKSAFQTAIGIRPDYADAYGSLALLSIDEGDCGQARNYAKRALEYKPAQPTALIALAATDFEEQLTADAEARIRELLDHARFGDDPHANDVLGALGDTLNRQGNVALAFETYTALHKRRHEIHAGRFMGRRAIDHVTRMLAYFRDSTPWVPSRTARPVRGAASGHVFLLGFARSGTTLLETVLATSDRTTVLDERDCFPVEARELLQTNSGLDRLAALEENELMPWREAYWDAVRNNGAQVSGRVFVDKWPFNSHRMPLLSKLFPDARILFAIRDPRDVVLSCFCRRFVINSDTFEFLLLEDCARFYAGVMGLAEEYRRKLPVRLHMHRYEDMIVDFDATVRAVCEFIGISWSADMREFRSSIEGNIDRNSQSKQQLSQGLYTGAVGQWRRFENELNPILPILQPWIERFGYPSN